MRTSVKVTRNNIKILSAVNAAIAFVIVLSYDKIKNKVKIKPNVVYLHELVAVSFHFRTMDLGQGHTFPDVT